jgi:CheY-like chemotaxis protein
VSQTILIADVDPERAARLSELCTQRGFSTRSVANGALALEVALADAPDLVVADFGLDLITGAQLAEILRANPRTRGVRFVFLGDRPDRAPPNDLDSDVIPTPIDEAEVVRRIERLLQRPARLNEIDRAQGEGNPLSGQLDQVALPDLLQLFHVNRRTGTVEVVQRERKGREQRGVIYVRDGNVIQAIAGTVDGEKALFRLLGWKTGSFAFTPDRAPVEARIETPTRALLMEGLRQLDEWESLRGSLPARDARVALRVTSSALPNMVHPLTQEVLLLLEIYTRVQDVVDSCSYPDYQVLRTLQTLVDRELVEVRLGPAEPAPSDAGLFAAAHARRLREWLAGGRAGDSASGDAKVLLVASDPVATLDFLNRLYEMPGVELADGIAEGRLAAHDLVEVAHLAVDAEAGLRLVHLPTRRVDAPLWPLISHGALAVIFLLSGPVAEARSEVRAIEEALRQLPRMRIFHALFLHKEDRPLPEELRENLSLIDEASLFLLPLDNANDCLTLMQRMFTRVLP